MKLFGSKMIKHLKEESKGLEIIHQMIKLAAKKQGLACCLTFVLGTSGSRDETSDTRQPENLPYQATGFI